MRDTFFIIIVLFMSAGLYFSNNNHIELDKIKTANNKPIDSINTYYVELNYFDTSIHKGDTLYVIESDTLTIFGDSITYILLQR